MDKLNIEIYIVVYMGKKKALLLTEGMHGMISQVEGMAKALNAVYSHKIVRLSFPWSLISPKYTPISLRQDKPYAILWLIKRYPDELSDSQIREIQSALKSKLGREINLSTEMDKNLLGGAVIRAGDIVIDGSVRAKLQSLANALIS